MGSDWAQGRGWEVASANEQCMPRAAGARALLTDVLGRQPQSLDHQRLLPPLGDAVQDPALEKQCGEALHYMLLTFTYFVYA